MSNLRDATGAPITSGYALFDDTGKPVGTSGSATNSFTTINADFGTDPVADSPTDTLNLVSGSGLRVSGDSSTDTVTLTPDFWATKLKGTVDGPDNTSSETTLFTYTIPADSLTYSTLYVARLVVQLLNNTGSNQGVRLKCYYDGTIRIDYDFGSNFASNATPRMHMIEFWTKVHPGDLTSTHQILHWKQTAATGTGTVNVGTGAPAAAGTMAVISSGGFTSAALTSNRILKITATLSTNSSSLKFVIESWNVTRYSETFNGTTGA